MWYVTCDMWHVTRDTWHVTHDTFGGGVDILSKLHLEEKDDSLNEWINDEAVYRTAPATPGLLNSYTGEPSFCKFVIKIFLGGQRAKKN